MNPKYIIVGGLLVGSLAAGEYVRADDTTDAINQLKQQINDLNQFSMTSAAKFLFDEVLGFAPTDEHLSQIAAARARAQQRLAELVEGLIFVKTHQALAIDRGHPTINFSVTAGAIYIVRNPLDVAISYAHHLGRSIDEAINLINSKNAETSVTEKQVYELYGSWSQHVLS